MSTTRARPPVSWPWLTLVSIAGACSSGTPTVPDRIVHFAAPGPALDWYRTERLAGDAVRGPYAALVQRGIARGQMADTPALLPDARLGELADWIVDALDADGAPPPYPVIDLWTRQLGLIEPAPHLVVLGQSVATGLDDRATSEVQALRQQQRYTHFGAATRQHPEQVFAVLVLSWRWLELRPVPRTVPAGAHVSLSGRLTHGLRDAQLVVSFPDGTSQRGAPQHGAAIAQALPLRGRGEHRIEVLANSPLGVTVVANFPLYVGVPPIRELSVAVPSAHPPLDEAAAKQRLLSLTNQERERAGLPGLVPDAILSRVARAHSRDMHEHGFVGHTSRTTGGAPDRVARSGIKTGVVLENIGRGYSPEEVHRGLMDSPGHRANLLHPQATHVGVGVVLAPENGRVVYLVTEVFVRFSPKIDLDQATDALVAALNRARTRRGLSALDRDRGLSELCARTAREFFTARNHPSEQQLLNQLSQRAGSTHASRKPLVGVMAVVQSIEEAAELRPLLEPGARRLGLGLAQGTRDNGLANSIAVVALVEHQETK